ncbi:MAG: response regulator [Thermoleophilia bacterium]
MTEQNVLVVDDEDVIRDVCYQILTADGYVVTTAASGKEALHLVSEHVYDAVVTDIMMPDMSGLELLEVIRSTNMELRTIVITGLGTFDMATQSDRLGAREFVVKPFTPDELSEAVRKALARR